MRKTSARWVQIWKIVKKGCKYLPIPDEWMMISKYFAELWIFPISHTLMYGIFLKFSLGIETKMNGFVQSGFLFGWIPKVGNGKSQWIWTCEMGGRGDGEEELVVSETWQRQGFTYYGGNAEGRRIVGRQLKPRLWPIKLKCFQGCWAITLKVQKYTKKIFTWFFGLYLFKSPWNILKMFKNGIFWNVEKNKQ